MPNQTFDAYLTIDYAQHPRRMSSLAVPRYVCSARTPPIHTRAIMKVRVHVLASTQPRLFGLTGQVVHCLLHEAEHGEQNGDDEQEDGVRGFKLLGERKSDEHAELGQVLRQREAQRLVPGDAHPLGHTRQWSIMCANMASDWCRQFWTEAGGRRPHDDTSGQTLARTRIESERGDRPVLGH